jgi:uncharacterized protein (TIGR02391 family)
MAKSGVNGSDRPSRRAPGGLSNLHVSIAVASGRQFANRHYDDAVFNAFKAVEDRVKKLTERPEIGKRLMTYVLNENSPSLDVTSQNSDPDQKGDEREGFKFLFMGALLGLRNPRGHGGPLATSEDEATEMLGLASLLMRMLDRAEERLALAALDTADEDENDEDDELGALDLIAVAEEAMPELSTTIGEMANCLTELGEVTDANMPKVEAAAQQTSMAARLVVIKAVADELLVPAQKFRELSADYVDQVTDLDGGMDALIRLKPFADMTIDEQAQYLFLAESVRGLRDASVAGIAAATSLSQSFKETAKLSRHLKKPSAELREGVRQMASVQHLYKIWVDGFDEAGVWGNPAA